MSDKTENPLTKALGDIANLKPSKPRGPSELAAPHSSAFEALVKAIERLTNDDWEKIYESTRHRLLAVQFDGNDTRSNRVLCEMLVMNAIFDMRDFKLKN
jgi:hypothetical protein